MSEISKVESKLDEIINKTLVDLKKDVICNIFEKMQTINHDKESAIVIWFNDKHARRDYSYNPKDCYECAFEAKIEVTEASIKIKKYFKDLIFFAMKYNPSDFDIKYENFYGADEKYDANVFLNSMVKSFFTSKELMVINKDKDVAYQSIFEDIVGKIKKEDKRKYSLITDKKHKMSKKEIESIAKREAELLNGLLNKEIKRNRI